MECLCHLYRVLGDSLDLEETLSSFERALRAYVKYAAISVHLVENGRLVPAHVTGESFSALLSLETACGNGYLEAALHTGRAFLNQEISGVPGLQRALTFPLENNHSITAVLALYHSPGNSFEEADLEVIRQIAPKLAAAVENTRVHQAAARFAGIDPVTGALNARSLFQRLDAELSRSRRRRDAVTVIQCEVDGICGDAPELRRNTLRRLADTLREHCREYDSVAWTGDKFILVVAGLTPADFGEKLARLQQAVADAGLRLGLPLSICTGAAFFPDEAADSEDLLSIADARLSRARRMQPA